MMKDKPWSGMGTLVTHLGEGKDQLHAHVTPIYQTSTFGFTDTASGAAVFSGQKPGYKYTRLGNPNQDQLITKICALEAYDLVNKSGMQPSEITGGYVFSSGMSAITAAILARVRSGQTIIAQRSLYSATFHFLQAIAPRYGINVVWLDNPTSQDWERAFNTHPDSALAYAESPANPSMGLVDLEAAAEIAHQHKAWFMVDNTFATPFCQRPLTLGVDVVVHSTTKYICGHGTIVGGAVISPHLDFVNNELKEMLHILGGSASPFDSWLANQGLKTFELRMERHCTNAMMAAEFLEKHPAVAWVRYPGLPSHPQYTLAKKQMHDFGGMLSFELKDGFQAGAALMDNVRLCTLAVSLGNVDTLIEHPASMTHLGVPAADREQAGLSDGLVRLSVGIENIDDILNDLDQGLQAAS
jgi:methionine-gamma-lyase